MTPPADLVLVATWCRVGGCRRDVIELLSYFAVERSLRNKRCKHVVIRFVHQVRQTKQGFFLTQVTFQFSTLLGPQRRPTGRTVG